jgi:hypothetical protein
METRAYITHEPDGQLRVTVHEGCTLYSEGDVDPNQSWVYPRVNDGVDHVMSAQPDQPFADADSILAEHGWTRESPRWLVGDVIIGTYARITRS